MKKAPIKKDGKKKGSASLRLIIIFSVMIPLIRTLILYPLTLIMQANSYEIGYEIVYYLSQAVTTLTFFAVLALTVSYVMTDNFALVSKAAAWQSLSLVVVGFMLQSLVLPFLALLDDIFGLSGFYFCNWTLSQLESADVIAQSAIYLFLNILAVLLMLGLSIAALFLIRKREIKSASAGIKNFTYRAPTAGELLNLLADDKKCTVTAGVGACSLVYMAVSLAQNLADSIMTVVNSGTPKSLSDIATLVSPYIVILVFTIAGRFFMQYIATLSLAAIEKDGE